MQITKLHWLKLKSYFGLSVNVDKCNNQIVNSECNDIPIEHNEIKIVFKHKYLEILLNKKWINSDEVQERITTRGKAIMALKSILWNKKTIRHEGPYSKY